VASLRARGRRRSLDVRPRYRAQRRAIEPGRGNRAGRPRDCDGTHPLSCPLRCGPRTPALPARPRAERRAKPGRTPCAGPRPRPDARPSTPISGSTSNHRIASRETATVDPRIATALPHLRAPFDAAHERPLCPHAPERSAAPNRARRRAPARDTARTLDLRPRCRAQRRTTGPRSREPRQRTPGSRRDPPSFVPPSMRSADAAGCPPRRSGAPGG
jgi:hypothetical protein